MASSTQGSSKQFIKELKEKDAVRSIFMATDKALLTDKNGKPYVSVNLKDSSGMVSARLWDNVEAMDAQFESGDFVKVKGHVQTFQNRLQIVIHDIERAPQTEVELGDFVSTSMRPPEVMMAELEGVVATLESPYIRGLLEATLLDKDIRWRLMRSPAAKTIHHAYMGGLLEHIVSITGIVCFLAEHYKWLNRDLLVFGAIYHDLGKIWEFDLSSGTQYSDKGRLIGHMVLAVETIERLSQSMTGVSERLKDGLKHMVLSHHGRLEYGSPKEPAFPEALVVAMVDEMDSRMNTLFEFMRSEVEAQAGSWSRLNSHFGRYFFLDFFRERMSDFKFKDGAKDL